MTTLAHRQAQRNTRLDTRRPGATAPAGHPVSRTEAATSAPSRSQTDAAALALLTLLVDLPEGSTDRIRARERLVEMYLPLAEHLARRFRNRGEQLEDLVQVASLALLKSIDGFDATRGAAFTSYAIPMIVGEIKRHFRDKGWDVRVPRRLQELRLEINKISGDLAQNLSRSPTVADLATALSVGEEEIIEALDCSQAYRALSLQAPVSNDENSGELVDLLGDADPGIETVENRAALRPLLATLPPREQRIIAMRFFGNLTQSQIALELGISQMHVSRLLAHALGVLREGLLET
jgi:RNA polymerase sigma-B factor